MRSTSLKVLVTAVGGDLGQALVKALCPSEVPIEILGCDADRQGVGAAFVDSYYLVPPAADEIRYLEVLDNLCRSLKVDAVLPGSEAEIALLSQLGSPCRLPSGTVVVCQERRLIDIYGDKLSCMQALQEKIELAQFADGSDQEAVQRLVASVGFPVVVKGRRSNGSRAVRIAQNQRQLGLFLEEIPLPVVQQWLEAAGGEFSACNFACDEFETMIAFRRKLGPVGCSWFAESSDDQDVLNYVRCISNLTKARGSINIQVARTSRGVFLLEINPRFSSLAAARAICGFRDVEWSLKMALGLETHPPQGEYKHIRFRRFFHELVDFGGGFQPVADWSPRQSTKVFVG